MTVAESLLSRRVAWCCVLGTVLPILCGCQRPSTPGPAEPIQLTADTSEEFSRLWECCQAVLRKHRFRIDRRDLYAGVITTRPETSQSVLEFWRHDVDTGYDLLEASLQTTRRWAEITLTPLDGGQYSMQVAVYKQRLRALERQVTDAAVALKAFSAEIPTTAGRRYDPKRDQRWLDQGRDPAMEQRITEQIQSAFQS